MTQLILVENNRGYAAALRASLEVEGYEVDLADDVGSGLGLIRRVDADLVVLELGLGGEHGFDLLEALRSTGNQVPILVLSTWRDDGHKERAFELGADDYVTKPVAMHTLLARITALLRRINAGDRAGPLWVRVGDIHIHPPRRIVEHRGARVALRRKEYDLLLALLRQRGHAVSRSDLLREVWRREPGQSIRTVDTHILMLRRKIEHDPHTPRHILTVYGKGYMLARTSEER